MQAAVSLAAGDPASLERATLAAVPPEAQQELGGWLLAFDGGTVSRAHSAVPLRHDAAVAHGGIVQEIAARYRARGMAPLLRVPDLPCFDGLRGALRAAGYTARMPVLTQAATVQDMQGAGDADAVQLLDAPDGAWRAAFMGEGFDPVDGEKRIAILRRGAHSVFACARVGGQVAAVGVGCYAEGWCGVHGMRTVPGLRGRGLGGAVLAALARQAKTRGIGRAFLQVEPQRAPALALYRRAGFATAWALDYWKAPRLP